MQIGRSGVFGGEPFCRGAGSVTMRTLTPVCVPRLPRLVCKPAPLRTRPAALTRQGINDMLRWLLGLFKASDSAAGGNGAAEAGSEPDDQPPSPFLRRESMLDRGQQVAAYVFTVDTPAAMRPQAWHAASWKFFDSVLIDHFASDKLAGLLGKRLAFLPLSAAGLEYPGLNRLPRQNLVIEFDPPPGVEFDGEVVLARLTALRESGFQISCGHGLGPRGLPAEALELARFISLGDVASQEPPDLLARCRQLGARYPESGLVARNIDSTELYQACRQMGIQLFQGRFLTQRDTSSANRIAPYRMFVVKLLNGIKQQADYGELAGIAWCDPALGYRLLRFVNSAAFGLSMKIDRLRHAMAYVGRDELYRWLTLLLFSSKEPNHLDESLRENALVRAKLVERLAEGRMSRKECDEAFVVGILSVIDALMEMPMQDALAQLSLPEAVSDALLRRQGNYAPYLKLSIACEESDQGSIQALAAECEMDAAMVNQRHIDALTWTKGFIEAMEDSPIGL
jgi:EAL and modified HD-GYP domain-containing signal transduction protein